MSNILKTVREDDFIEYYITPTNFHREDELLDLRNKLSRYVTHLTENYIWHKDEFTLNKSTNLPSEESDDEAFVHAVIHYGENVEDEWFVVHILKEISHHFDVFVRVVDSDGEFLLIEAAEELPRWMRPENCEKRVYLHKNVVRILPLSVSPNDVHHNEITSFLCNQKITEVEETITKFINNKVSKFSNGFEDLLHKSRVYLPAKVAVVLDTKPKLISAVVNAYCQRDIIDRRACRKMEYFPPNDLVLRLLTFTKFLYAMISQEKCDPERKLWHLPSPSNPQFREYQLGFKITCGFEILMTKCCNKSQSDLTLSKKWNQYIQVLKRKGYFKDLIENSKEYVQLEKKARDYFLDNIGIEDMGDNNILNILQTVKYDVKQMKTDETKLPLSDSETWMNIDEEKFNKLLEDRFSFRENITNSPKILSSALDKFLRSVSDVEGIEIKSEKMKNQFSKMDIDDENAPVCFNSEDFMSSMEKMLGILEQPSDSSAVEVKSCGDSEESEGSNSGDEETDETEDPEMKEYMDLMDKELQNSTLSKSFISKTDGETLGSVDLDMNALANILKSYDEQRGGSGPVGNLLHSIGLKVDTRKSP